MSAYDDAIANAARLLNASEAGYVRTYGAVPIDTRHVLASKWIDLANATREDVTR